MTATVELDPVTQEILASALHHIAEEMAVVEYRSSYSPIIREMLDFNCGLFTADGRMVANSEQIPAQLGLMQFALESVLLADQRAQQRALARAIRPQHGDELALCQLQ